MKNPLFALVAAPRPWALALALTAAAGAQAQIVVSEVDPTGSNTATYAADWFELTNRGSTAVNIAGWKMDDDSNAFGSAVALRGVTSIAAGQSVVFVEGTASGSTDAAIDANFKAAWFGSNVPAGFTIGNYGGSGVGLGSGGDAVNIFSSTGVAIASVSFGAATTGRTFDNTAGSNGTISQLSAVGTNGAFTSVAGNEIGSPGVVMSVPEPTGAAIALAGFAALGVVARRRRP